MTTISYHVLSTHSCYRRRHFNVAVLFRLTAAALVELCAVSDAEFGYENHSAGSDREFSWMILQLAVLCFLGSGYVAWAALPEGNDFRALTAIVVALFFLQGVLLAIRSRKALSVYALLGVIIVSFGVYRMMTLGFDASRLRLLAAGVLMLGSIGIVAEDLPGKRESP